MGNVEEVLRTEWSGSFERDVTSGMDMTAKVKKFLQLCKDAMVVSFHKYGLVRDGCGPGKASIPIESIERRLGLYESGGEVKGEAVRPGNTEWLTDAYNFAMMEAMHPRGSLVYGRSGTVHESRRVEQVRTHVKRFANDRNYRHLVAIGRLALGEFCDPQVPGAHFRGTDASPGRMTVEGESERRNLVSSVKNFR